MTETPCYTREDATRLEPFTGMVEGKHLHYPGLEIGTQSRMKVMFPEADLPIGPLRDMPNEAFDPYRNDVIPVNKK